MTWLLQVLGELDWFSLTLGLAGLIATILVAVVSTRQLNRISKALDDKINNIEELTRKPVTDFPTILRYAEAMAADLLAALEDPDHDLRFPGDCFWLLNYTPVLGRVYSYNSLYGQDPRFRDDPVVQTIAKRSLSFSTKVEALSKVSTGFRLVTVLPRELEVKFLRPILKKFPVLTDLDQSSPMLAIITRVPFGMSCATSRHAGG